MDTLTFSHALESIPTSLQIIIPALLLAVLYATLTAERPYAGFPLITVDNKGAKTSWMWHGHKALAKGLEQMSKSLLTRKAGP